MTANKMFTIRTVGLTAILLAAAALALLAIQPASAAGLDTTDHAPVVDQQTVPEPPPPEGEQPGEGPIGDGETAVADGGSATPWVAIGIGVLLVLALFAAYWASRKPGAVDVDPAVKNQDHRYIPPGM